MVTSEVDCNSQIQLPERAIIDHPIYVLPVSVKLNRLALFIPMTKIIYHDKYKDENGKWHYKFHRFDTEKSDYICNTPNGRLYRKRGRKPCYYLFHERAETQREHITVVSWKEANQLCRTYGTKLLHQQFFSVKGKSDHIDTKRHVRLTPKEWVKVDRNADFLKMNATEFIRYLINKYDSGRSYQ